MSVDSVSEHEVDDLDVAGFRESGFLRVPRLFDDAQLEVLRDVIERSTAAGGMGLAGQANAPTPEVRPVDFSYQAQEMYVRMFSNDVDLRLRYPELTPLVARAAAVARQLSAPKDVRILWDQTFSKPPSANKSRMTVWHQDQPHVPLDRRGFFTVWIAVNDVPAESGALRFVPRSHRLGPLGRTDFLGPEPGIDEILRADDLERVGEPVVVELEAGDASIHDGYLLHGAGQNLTDRPRVGWAIIFIPEDARWTGAPNPHDDLQQLGMQVFDTFDLPQFAAPR
jgi:ectoine hydroxylase-related dioxygenase (phytanoyl-CoA dioxygenase family)